MNFKKINFEYYKKDIIEAYIEYFGEEFRDYIEERINNTLVECGIRVNDLRNYSTPSVIKYCESVDNIINKTVSKHLHNYIDKYGEYLTKEERQKYFETKNYKCIQNIVKVIPKINYVIDTVDDQGVVSLITAKSRRRLFKVGKIYKLLTKSQKQQMKDDIDKLNYNVVREYNSYFPYRVINYYNNRLNSKKWKYKDSLSDCFDEEFHGFCDDQYVKYYASNSINIKDLVLLHELKHVVTGQLSYYDYYLDEIELFADTIAVEVFKTLSSKGIYLDNITKDYYFESNEIMEFLDKHKKEYLEYCIKDEVKYFFGKYLPELDLITMDFNYKVKIQKPPICTKSK
jgi:hypothetical protein